MPKPRGTIELFAGTSRNSGGTGLRAIHRDENGAWKVGPAYTGAQNASFGIYSPRHDLHYLVDEQAAGSVGVHRHDREGWTRLASISTDGDSPCHVTSNPAGTMLAAANYASGSVSLIRLDAQTGIPTHPADVRTNRGSGPNRQRQEAPHAHWVGFSPDGRLLYQTDLGTDEILAFPVDTQNEIGAAQPAFTASAGSGPRHLLLHPRMPNRAYLASELANTLTVLDRNGATFAERCTLSTLPPAWQDDSIVAHIAINTAGDRLYVSNRGHDSIAVFALDADGMPSLLQHAPAGGEYPRHFLLLEERHIMVVANEKEQTVTILPLETDGRLLSPIATLPVPGVAFILRA